MDVSRTAVYDGTVDRMMESAIPGQGVQLTGDFRMAQQ
jgi:hypothetical protein